jgi:hypothetical protein
MPGWFLYVIWRWPFTFGICSGEQETIQQLLSKFLWQLNLDLKTHTHKTQSYKTTLMYFRKHVSISIEGQIVTKQVDCRRHSCQVKMLASSIYFCSLRTTVIPGFPSILSCDFCRGLGNGYWVEMETSPLIPRSERENCRWRNEKSSDAKNVWQPGEYFVSLPIQRKLFWLCIFSRHRSCNPLHKKKISHTWIWCSFTADTNINTL